MRGERANVTLQATALLNEAYLRLVDVQRMNWQGRAHFLAMAARIMRRVLVDAARARQAQRRGAAAARVTLDEALLVGGAPGIDVILVSDALEELSGFDQRKAQVVELRYFGGMTVEETAEALAVSPETVARDWRLAKAWLRRKMEGAGA